MSFVRSSLALALSYLVENSRSRTALFWTLAFPQLFLFVFAFVFAGGEPQRVAYLMPGLLTLTTITSAFFGYSMRLVAERERGALRRLRVTPTPAGAVVAGHMMHAMVNLSVSLLFQLSLAKLIFRFPLHGSLGNLLLMLLAGELAFVPLGLFVGCIGRDTRSAPALNNLIVFPMMFLSGSALPFFLLPGWVQQVARLLPATYLNEGLQRVMISGQTDVRARRPDRRAAAVRRDRPAAELPALPLGVFRSPAARAHGDGPRAPRPGTRRGRDLGPGPEHGGPSRTLTGVYTRRMTTPPVRERPETPRAGAWASPPASWWWPG